MVLTKTPRPPRAMRMLQGLTKRRTQRQQLAPWAGPPMMPRERQESEQLRRLAQASQAGLA
eukprot:9889269-Lingulodinium_polyedra.AAC.1